MSSHAPIEPKPSLPGGWITPVDGASKGTSFETRVEDDKPAHGSAPTAKSIQRHYSWRRWLVRSGIGFVVLCAVAYFGVPAVRRMLDTVSTDDAYVNSHVTFVAPRVSG